MAVHDAYVLFWLRKNWSDHGECAYLPNDILKIVLSFALSPTLSDLKEMWEGRMVQFVDKEDKNLKGYFKEPYYRSLKRLEGPLTFKRALGLMEPHMDVKEYRNKIPDDKFDSSFRKILDQTTEVSYMEMTKIPVNNRVHFCEADGFFDLKVYNATYAYLCVQQTHIELEKLEDHHTILDLTYDNPFLMKPFIYLGTVFVDTDGNRVSYNRVHLGKHSSYMYNDLKQTYIQDLPSQKSLLFVHTNFKITKIPYQQVDVKNNGKIIGNANDYLLRK